MSGEWTVQQSDGFTVFLNLQQNGTSVTGNAEHHQGVTEGKGLTGFGYSGVTVNGQVSGNINGNDFYMDIDWGNTTNGIYRGTVGAQGRIDGSMYHKQIPKNKATWFSSIAMTCADVAPTPAKKELKSKPRATPSLATPTPTPITKLSVKPPPMEPEAAAAGISASEENGIVTLTWNAGGGHPNTEVWVKVNDHDEKLLFTGSKGTKTVSVKPGKKYHYILREAGGEQLDTATVKTGR